jgi:hypothetical protein
MSCRIDEPSLSDKCSRKSRNAAVGSSGLAATAIEGCQHKEAKRQPGGQPADLDSRTRMLLEKPITAMILRLAIPNATVMTVQVLIGLLEVYFVSRLGVDALAGVAPVFPLVSLVLAITQGAIGGGIVTTVARALGTGRISDASEYAWYAVALAVPLGPRDDRRHVCVGSKPVRLYGHLWKCSRDRPLLFIHYGSSACGPGGCRRVRHRVGLTVRHQSESPLSRRQLWVNSQICGRSGVVLVFGRRDDDTIHALLRPASKSAKARNRGKWGTGGAAGAMEI